MKKRTLTLLVLSVCLAPAVGHAGPINIGGFFLDPYIGGDVNAFGVFNGPYAPLDVPIDILDVSVVAHGPGGDTALPGDTTAITGGTALFPVAANAPYSSAHFTGRLGSSTLSLGGVLFHVADTNLTATLVPAIGGSFLTEWTWVDITVGAEPVSTPVPEPGSTLLLLSVGLTGIGLRMKRMRGRSS